MFVEKRKCSLHESGYSFLSSLVWIQSLQSSSNHIFVSYVRNISTGNCQKDASNGYKANGTCCIGQCLLEL